MPPDQRRPRCFGQLVMSMLRMAMAMKMTALEVAILVAADV